MGKFRIKIKPTWFSKDFIVLRYSTNGIFWKSVKTYEYDTLSNKCYMVSKVSSFKNTEYLLKEFNTLEKVKKYESEQRDKVRKHNKEIKEKNRIHRKKRSQIYKKYS